MADWSSSHFLQALGWATLNSFWQMALLWCIFQVVTHFMKWTSNQKYLFAVTSVVLGFVWFLYSFSIYYINGFNTTALSTLSVELPSDKLSIVLSCASVAYLLLLIVPAIRIFRNWSFLKSIKTKGLEKAPYRYRLFAQQISGHLGIKKSVKIYLSALVSSPMTVGFLKPIVLIPLASLNHLTVQQLEAVILHELSHIRRQDYLINLLLSLIQTVLYFNPFVKLFIKRADVERENCCDELVLQFEYDKLSYASALLQLEKNAQGIPELVMAAANKNFLLSRIEKIVGIYRKPAFNTYHFSGAFSVVLLLFVINSVLIAGREKLSGLPFHDLSEPFAFFINTETKQDALAKNEPVKFKNTKHSISILKEVPTPQLPQEPTVPPIPLEELQPTHTENMNFIQVALDESDGVKLETEQKLQVTKAVEETRKVLEMNWREVEKSIGDGMTAAEKVKAKQEYIAEINKINWKNVEKGLKSQYNEINWDVVNENIANSMAVATIDSVHEACNKVAVELNRIKNTSNAQAMLIPDVSIQQIEKAKADVQKQLDELKKLKATRKAVRL